MTVETSWTEAERLAALRAYGVLNTAPETGFDDLAALAAEICETPTALVSLVDRDVQWFKARVGMEACETGRDVSFCDHAMREHGVTVVTDATLDPRFAANALVTGEPRIRFYAGAPLVSPDGFPLGSLCVIDDRPRPEGLTPIQNRTLAVLADQVVNQLELRRALAQGRLDDANLVSAGVALADSEARFRAIADTMPQMVWSARPGGFRDYYNARWYEFTGMPAGSTDGDGWHDAVHPDDLVRVRDRWRQSSSTGELYEVEYRLRRNDGVHRWVLGRATPIRNAAGEVTRWFGTSTDIDDLKRIEEGKDLLSQELSHRIKNIFAVVSSLIALSAREHPEAKAFAGSVRERVGALARAHEFVRPHSETSQPLMGDTTLHAFLDALFRPYAAADGSARVVIEGDDATFDDQAATSVALLFHELATNAAKYGALSVAEGRVLLQTRNAGDRFILTWTEKGGPPVAEIPARQGFGSALSALSVEGQLGGRLERRWTPGGLILEADLPATALSRRRVAQGRV